MRRIIFVLSFCFLAFFLSPLVRAGDDWQPISPEELKMTSEPKAPGASAIYLYRQVDRDDEKFNEIDYARIKIFTDEGRKYADVEIPYVKGFGSIKGIRARTIHPDGSIVNFDGRIFDKMVVKAKGVQVLVKTFNMPSVKREALLNIAMNVYCRRAIFTTPSGFSAKSCLRNMRSFRYDPAITDMA
jgi:hypothetical protein